LFLLRVLRRVGRRPGKKPQLLVVGSDDRLPMFSSLTQKDVVTSPETMDLNLGRKKLA
jgi:hypothetical protein